MVYIVHVAMETTGVYMYMKWYFGLIRDDYSGFYCLNFVSSLIDKNVFLEVHVCWCKSTCLTQSFSCPKKLIKIAKTRE
jgi:hypothetical protein